MFFFFKFNQAYVSEPELKNVPDSHENLVTT